MGKEQPRVLASDMPTELLIIGAGNMGSALAKGLKGGAFQVTLCDVHAGRLAELGERLGVKTCSEPVGALPSAGVVALCVKPQDLAVVAGALRGHLPSGTVVISILAGVTIEALATTLEFRGGIVRSMPNIAATVHAAATALCANEACTPRQKQLAEQIFAAIGEVDWTKEALLDAVTGLSGSGPAYIYMIIEALTDGGVKMGIPRALAARLATQTVLGSALLVKETGAHPATLRDQVTTPGGTTIHALHALEERGLRAMLISAVETATKRSASLNKGTKVKKS